MRDIAVHAGEVLAARARAGRLAPQAADALRPLLDVEDRFNHRRRAAIAVLGAMRDRASVPVLAALIDAKSTPTARAEYGTDDLLNDAVTALGSIADAAAVPALARLAAQVGQPADNTRVGALTALLACLADSAEIDETALDGVIVATLDAIKDRNDSGLAADLHLALARLLVLRPARRDELRELIAATPPRTQSDETILARAVALGEPVELRLRGLLHNALTKLAYNHDQTVARIRRGLAAAELVPELLQPADLVALTRYLEPDIRRRAHALLAAAGRPTAPARGFDPVTARALADAALVEAITAADIVNRAALVAEAQRRGLATARSAVIEQVGRVIERARPGNEDLLVPDSRLLEAAVRYLVVELDEPTIELFDRMLRHSNPKVKWDLLQDPPADARLASAMLHVLGEKWGWQETAARTWLTTHAPDVN